MIRKIIFYEIVVAIVLYLIKQLSHSFWFVDFGDEFIFLIMVIVPAVYLLFNIHIWIPELFSGVKKYYILILIVIALVVTMSLYDNYQEQEKQKKYDEELRQARIERAEKQLKRKGYFVLPGEKIICFYDLSCKEYAMYGYMTYSNMPSVPAKWFWDFTGGIDSNVSNKEIRKKVKKRVNLIEKALEPKREVYVRTQEGAIETQIIRNEYYNKDILTAEELFRLKKQRVFTHIKQEPEHIYWKRELFEN